MGLILFVFICIRLHLSNSVSAYCILNPLYGRLGSVKSPRMYCRHCYSLCFVTFYDLVATVEYQYRSDVGSNLAQVGEACKS